MWVSRKIASRTGLKNYKDMTSSELTRTKLYRLLLQVKYVELGTSKMSYLRYAVAGSFLSGINTGLLFTTIFGIVGYIIGRVWFKKGVVNLENEIANQFNNFQKEMRSIILKK